MPRTILVIDDEIEIGEIIGTVLERKGYRVLIASSFAQGVSFWENEKQNVDLVLSDLGAIGTQEKRFSEIFRKPDLKVAYMSGSSPDEVKGRYGPDFIQKPFLLEELARFVDQRLI